MSKDRFPSLESLRVFEACARLGGFTRAAGELGITQAAVSLRMRNLQADLDLILFERTRPLRLSSAGSVLASGLAEGLAAMRRAVREARSQEPIRVSVQPTFARWLASRLDAFERLRDDWSVVLEVSPEVRSLERDGFDLAVRSGVGGWKDLVATRLIDIERTPAMSPASAAQLPDPFHPADIRGLPIHFEEAWPRWFAAAGCPVQALEYSPTRLPTQDLLADAIIAGPGVALLSPLLFAPMVRAGFIVMPFDTVLKGPDAYYLVHPDRELRPAAAAFAQWLIDQTASLDSER